MARDTPPAVEAYVVIDNSYMLPFDDGIELLRLLAKAQKVSYNYGSGSSTTAPYKLQKDNNDVSLKIVTLAQYAIMCMDVTE